MLDPSRVHDAGFAPPPLDPRATAVFLDLDGTIAEIVARPDEVGPDALLTNILERLCATMEGRVAVLTGRCLEDADRILEGRIASVAAIHGLVRRLPDGSVERFPGSPELLEAKQLLLAFAHTQTGLTVEDKGLSMALHYRQVPQAEGAVRAATERIAKDAGLAVQAGSMVSEVRTPGPDKGHSLKEFLNVAPFAGHVPIMLGDELTDEHAFNAAEEMGGYGILVGQPRATAARYRLASVSDVRSWLATGARV